MTWPKKYLHIDYTKVFSAADCRISDSQQFPYIINLQRESMPWTWTEWCKENCEGIWGWWFDNESCYVGFEIQSEAMWFALKFQDDVFPEETNK